MLLLFDIDATLLKTSGVGIQAMVQAGRSLFGPSFSAQGIETAGRLDPLIIADMLRRSGQEPSRSNIEAVRRGYREHLGPLLRQPGVAYALPGVPDLLHSLEAAGIATLGLLTGNFPETGRMKLAACGLNADRFPVQVWGDDSSHDPPAREHLPPIGLERYRTLHGRAVPPSQATIIGDTPHDVRCAKLHRLRALGVATGPYSAAQLRAAGADRVVDSLVPTDELVGWLLG